MRELRHFAPQEFEAGTSAWMRDCCTLLDEFRDQLGEPVIISPAHGIYRAPSRSG